MIEGKLTRRGQREKVFEGVFLGWREKHIHDKLYGSLKAA